MDFVSIKNQCNHRSANDAHHKWPTAYRATIHSWEAFRRPSDTHPIDPRVEFHDSNHLHQQFFPTTSSLPLVFNVIHFFSLLPVQLTTLDCHLVVGMFSCFPISPHRHLSGLECLLFNTPGMHSVKFDLAKKENWINYFATQEITRSDMLRQAVDVILTISKCQKKKAKVHFKNKIGTTRVYI